MSFLAILLPEIIGLTILHSLWQIMLLWIILITVLRLWPKASSDVRYTLAISTLMLSVLTTAATAVNAWQSHVTDEGVSIQSHDTAETMPIVYITIKQHVSSTIVDELNASVPIFAWLWFTGLVVMGIRFAGSFFYLSRLRAHENIAAISPVWQNELKRLSLALRLRCGVSIATSARISSPLTLGSISPIILVPAGLLSGLSNSQIEAILIHELYHIKRRDYIINICQALVEVVLFYHPAIWHINKIVREERENYCDDLTVRFCGDAITYARALTQIQEINTLTKPTLAISATGPNAGNFTHRIKRLFHIYPNPAQARSKGIFALGFLIVYLCIVLASANALTAEPIEMGKPIVNDPKMLGNISEDSIRVSDHLFIRDKKEITPQPVVREKIRSMDIQLADTDMSGQSLNECIKQFRLFVKMASISRRPGESLRFATFSAEDSLHIVRSMDYLSESTLKRQSTRFHKFLNVSRFRSSYITDTTSYWTTKNVTLENNNRTSVDSIKSYNNQQATSRYGDEEKDGVIDVRPKPGTSIEEFTEGLAVHVVPNSTTGYLNISFTPPHRNSHVKMVLINSDGKVEKEIINSTYDNIPTALHVDVSSFKKGLYILQINIDSARSQQRVVVE